MAEQENSECPNCGMDGLVELKYATIKVTQRVGCPFWYQTEIEDGRCSAIDIDCPEEGEIWPDCCPLLCYDGVCVEIEK